MLWEEFLDLENNQLEYVVNYVIIYASTLRKLLLG
jgi:hypothetical protein